MAAKSTFGNMVLCLGVITLVCGALLSGVYILTRDSINEAEDGKVNDSLAQVAPDFDREEAVEMEGGTVYYIVYSSDKVAGYVIPGTATGFGGGIELMVGFLPDGTISGTAVLKHSETPGLGAKCVEEDFSGQFPGFNPNVGKLSVRQDGGDIDAISAATITSRAYCAAVEDAFSIFREVAVVPEIAEPADSLGIVEPADSLGMVEQISDPVVDNE